MLSAGTPLKPPILPLSAASYVLRQSQASEEQQQRAYAQGAAPPQQQTHAQVAMGTTAAPASLSKAIAQPTAMPAAEPQPSGSAPAAAVLPSAATSSQQQAMTFPQKETALAEAAQGQAAPAGNGLQKSAYKRRKADPDEHGGMPASRPALPVEAAAAASPAAAPGAAAQQPRQTADVVDLTLGSDDGDAADGAGKPCSSSSSSTSDDSSDDNSAAASGESRSESEQPPRKVQRASSYKLPSRGRMRQTARKMDGD